MPNSRACSIEQLAARSGAGPARPPAARPRSCAAPRRGRARRRRPRRCARAARDRQQRRQHLHGRRFAGAVRPEEAEHLAVLDAQVDPADRLDVAVVLDQPFCLHRDFHVLVLRCSVRAIRPRDRRRTHRSDSNHALNGASKPPGRKTLNAVAGASLRFWKSWVTPGGMRTNVPRGASTHCLADEERHRALGDEEDLLVGVVVMRAQGPCRPARPTTRTRSRRHRSPGRRP